MPYILASVFSMLSNAPVESAHLKSKQCKRIWYGLSRLELKRFVSAFLEFKRALTPSVLHGLKKDRKMPDTGGLTEDG
jgi:hypothetical protein